MCDSSDGWNAKTERRKGRAKKRRHKETGAFKTCSTTTHTLARNQALSAYPIDLTPGIRRISGTVHRHAAKGSYRDGGWWRGCPSRKLNMANTRIYEIRPEGMSERWEYILYIPSRIIYICAV